jgi:hypothetical protein
LIAPFVIGNLVPPEFGILFWLGVAPGTAVPETAVNKGSKSFLGEDEIGFAGQWLMSSPSRYAVLAEKFQEFNFR